MNKNRIKTLMLAILVLAALAGGIGYNSYLKAHTFTLSGNEQIQPINGTVNVSSPRDTEVIFIDVKTGDNYAIPYITSGQSESIQLEKDRWYTIENGEGLTIRLVNISTVLIHGEDELTDRVREELPLPEADILKMEYMGICGVDNHAIAWFELKDEQQSSYYYPVELEVKGTDEEYSFVQAYDPMPNEHIAFLNWTYGYAFCIDNPEVVKAELTLENGEVIEEVIQPSTTPHLFSISATPTACVFMDDKGEDILSFQLP